MTSVTRETIIVSDTSPVIGLAKIGRLSILGDLAETVLIPRAVWDELLGGGSNRPEVAEIIDRFKRSVCELDDAAVAKFRQEVDEGEAAALALALAHPGCLLLIDDAAGRGLAEAHRLRCIGTAGMLLRAKRAGFINSLAPELEALKREGIFLREELIAKLLQAAGELPKERDGGR